MTALGALLGLLSLLGSTALSGRVVLPDGQPAAGARVVLFYASGELAPLLPAEPENVPGARVTTAGPDGGFVFPAFVPSAQTGHPVLYARGPEGRVCFRRWWLSPETLVLRLTATRVEGKFATPAGAALPPGATFRLVGEPRGGHEPQWLGEVQAAADGSFAVAGCPPGAYQVVVLADPLPNTDRRRYLHHRQVTVPAEQATRLELPLPARTLTGRVVDAAGRPVAGTLIELRRAFVATYVRPDGQGQFRAGFLEPGPYVLSLHDGHVLRSLRIEVPADVDPPPLRLECWTQAQRLRLLDPAGQPVRSTSFRLSSDGNGSSGWSTAVTDQNGCYRLDMGDWVGLYHGLLIRRGVGYAVLDIATDARPVGTRDVQLQGGGIVTGQLVSQDGRPVGGVPVLPHRTDDDALGPRWADLFMGRNTFAPHAWPEVTAVSADGTGAFTLGPLPPGHYRLDLEPVPLLERVAVPATVASGDPVVRLPAAALTVPPGSQSVSGTVLDRRRRPIRNQVVRIWQRADPSLPREVRTDAQGRFHLWPVPPGPGQLAVDNGQGSWPWHKYEVKDQPVTGIVLWLGEPTPPEPGPG